MMLHSLGQLMEMTKRLESMITWLALSMMGWLAKWLAKFLSELMCC
jgi:hypothetical protein